MSKSGSGVKFFLLSFLLLITSLFAGVVITFGGLKATIITAGILAGVVFLLLPLNYIFWILFVLTFFVIGQTQYFLGLKQSLWIPYLITLGLFFRIPLEFIRSNNNSGKRAQLPIEIILALLFVFFVVSSSVLNLSPIFQFIVSIKNYVAFWSLLILFYISRDVLEAPAEKVWSLLKYVVLFQIPLVFYQYFFVASKRSIQGGRGVAWDAVVGGFGGDPEGGGASGTLAYFVVLGLCWAMIRWQNKLSGFFPVIGYLLVSVLLMVMAEIKVVIILLPIAVMVVFRGEIIKRPWIFFGGLIISLVVLALVLQAYQVVQYKGTHKESDLLDMFTQAFSYSFDPSLINMATGEMGRMAAFTFWWEYTGWTDFFHAIIGYGSGASRSLSSFAVGELASRFSFRIDRSSAVQILWDTGLLGLLSYISILFFSILKAIKLAKRKLLESHSKTRLEISIVGLVLMLFMLPYGRDTLEVPAMQLILVLLLANVMLVNLKPSKKQYL